MSGQELLNQLLTEDLSGVTFVRDYLQLQFNPPPQINVYSNCSVTVRNLTAEFGEADFPNLIISCIGLAVTAVRDLEVEQRIVIELEQGAQIAIPYFRESFTGPEAVYLQGRSDTWGVWPG